MIEKWAQRWGIPPAAVADLTSMLTAGAEVDSKPVKGGEAAAQQLVRLEASRQGRRLWRNNNGACLDQSGRMIRYGICNDSKRVNEKFKSSDLIGITPVTVTPEYVGRTLGVFTSVEIKAPGWTYRNTSRERAQMNWLQLVAGLGGLGAFVTGPGGLPWPE